MMINMNTLKENIMTEILKMEYKVMKDNTLLEDDNFNNNLINLRLQLYSLNKDNK